MAVNLYEHQRKAVENLRPGRILCGDVGTGKSRTALAYFYEKVCRGHLPRTGSSTFSPMLKPRPLYVITTARKRDTGDWDAEMVPFPIDDYTVDSWNNIKKYVDVTDAFFIFDEQRLVGNGTWVKSFYKIADKNLWILLSATPGDNWMDYVPVFVANGLYRNKSEFVRRHVVYSPYVKFPKVLKYLEEDRLERLKASILIKMESEKKAVQHHSWVKVGYSQDLYSIVTKERWNPYQDEPIKNMSQLCYLERKVANSDKRRIEAVQNILQNHPRIVLFYNFDYELEMLSSWLDEIGVSYSQWNGHKHEMIPSGASWMYLVQYLAGCEGWNCIETDTIIFFSQNYSYKVMYQASGRIDRMNTPYYDLYYYHLFSDARIDRAIKRCLKQKKTFNERSYVA